MLETQKLDKQPKVAPKHDAKTASPQAGSRREVLRWTSEDRRTHAELRAEWRARQLEESFDISNSDYRVR